MDYKYINQLLERYWNGETSLEEEKILRTFFSQTDIPADLEQYRPFFVYTQEEVRRTVLGDDFDERILSLVDEAPAVKARTVSLTQRMMPLFKAAAMVAIIITLVGALQMPFQHDYPEMNGQPAAIPGMSVALSGDSAMVDTLQQSSLQKLPPSLAPVTNNLQPATLSHDEEQ